MAACAAGMLAASPVVPQLIAAASPRAAALVVLAPASRTLPPELPPPRA
jgi:hypothetical protein